MDSANILYNILYNKLSLYYGILEDMTLKF